MSPEQFSSAVLDWYDEHGRHDLPWQQGITPYRVWVSEIMLQQTQVSTVLNYFDRFMQALPTVQALAEAPEDEVLHLWTGLGYYTRARNLQKAAKVVVEQHGGEFPRSVEQLTELPGIGRSTAGAIASISMGIRAPILDGNVKRVLARHAGIAGYPGLPAVQQKLWRVSESHLPQARLADYTQAIMDLGAAICTSRKPLCGSCPVSEDCVALRENRIAELPGPKPRKVRPRRASWLLLIENERGDLLLERRPPSGIWGSLWCPPVVELADDWRSALQERYGLQVGQPETLAAVHHAFTHYDLELRPLRVRLAKGARIADASVAWTTMHDPDALPGLPAPVRKLVEAAYFSTPDLLSL